MSAVTENQKTVPPPTKIELQELEQDYIVKCTKIPWKYKNKGATYLLQCNLCEKYLEIVHGAKCHIEGKTHVQKKILKKVEERLKLVRSPNEEQFDVITAKLQEVYDEWSAEACGQQTVREKIVSDFQEFVQQTKGCEGIVVELFGSTYTGFALKSSDINMNLKFRDNPSDGSQSSYWTVMSAVIARLKNTDDNGVGAMYADLKTDLYSSVSHITFTHRPSGLTCHVRYGCHHGAPICTSKLLQRYGTVDHRVKVLAVVLKYWAKLCQLDILELGSYPSQMFVLMLIYFLQHRTPPLLPVPPKPNNFGDTPQQRQEHFDEYLNGLDYMIKTWKVTSIESLGMLWLDMLRFYYDEDTLGSMVVQVTEEDVLSKEGTSWSSYKLPVVLSPASPFLNIAKACSSRKMYVYLEACFKTTLVYFGRALLDKPLNIPHTEGHKQQQGAASHSPENNPSTTAKSSKFITLRADIASQLCDFNDEQPIKSLDSSNLSNQTTSTTTRSRDLDCDASCDLDHDESLDFDYDVSHDLTSEVETPCEHNVTHLEDSVVVEDIEVSNDDTDDIKDKELQYQFISSSFTAKKLPSVCSLCKQEGHTFTSPSCSSRKETKKHMLASHRPLAIKELKELDKVFVNLKEILSLKKEDRTSRKSICDIIGCHIKKIYPNAELMLFGSSANEFGSSNSDIDISMKLPGNFEHDDNAKVIENIASHLKTASQQSDWLVDTIQAITTARVPLVKMKLTNKWNNLECDISLGNYLALHNTQLLAHYAKIDERVQVMGYVLKEFAKSAEMCDASSGSLSSYAYIILLLHYLQQVKPPVIPVLQQIGEGGHVDVDGWNCWFYWFDDLSQLEKIWPHVGENKKTIGELLINFFKYYLKEFDWQRHVVSIRQLEPLNKLEMEWTSKRVCIEDPFNHGHNLSSHLTSKMWSYICKAFEYAHNHFTNPRLYNQPLTIITALSVGFVKDVPQDGLCYICKKRGHSFYNCPQKGNTCDLCGKEGHINAQCPSSLRGHSPRHHGLWAHPTASPHIQCPFQYYVVSHVANKHPIKPNDTPYRGYTTHVTSKHPARPSDTPDQGYTKKKTGKPVISTATPSLTATSQSHGRPPSHAKSQRSQFAWHARDGTVDSTASHSSRRVHNQQTGGNKGRKSKGMTDAHHRGSKQ